MNAPLVAPKPVPMVRTYTAESIVLRKESEPVGTTRMVPISKSRTPLAAVDGRSAPPSFDSLDPGNAVAAAEAFDESPSSEEGLPNFVPSLTTSTSGLLSLECVH